MDIQLIADHGLYRYVVQCIAEYPLYSYLIIFGWTFVEGETIVLIAAFMAAQGLLDPLLLLVVSGFGSYLGDQCYFWLGRHYGVRLLKRFPSWRPGVENALSWLERYDVWFILSFRFIYGVRNFSSFALGLSAVRWDRFLRLNFLAAMVWAASFCRDRIFPRSRLQHCRQHRELARLCAARRVRRARLRHLAAAPPARRRHARRNAKPVGARQMLPPN